MFIETFRLTSLILNVIEPAKWSFEESLWSFFFVYIFVYVLFVGLFWDESVYLLREETYFTDYVPF